MYANLARYLFVLISIMLLGFAGIFFFFSDLGPDETMAGRVLIATVYYFVSGVIVGFMATPTWWLSAGVAWDTVLLGLIALLNGVAASNEWIELLIIIVVPVVAAVSGGYSAQRWFRNKGS
jgi:hypothetical protein